LRGARNTILFGLSGNPPTGLGGHAGIVRWAATRPALDAFAGEGVDEVWVLPVYVHAFADKKGMAAFEHRLRMCALAFQDGLPEVAGRVRVLDVERTLGTAAGPGEDAHPHVRVGTIDVVRHLMAAHPERRFALLLGADTHRDLLEGKWKDSEALLALVPVVAIPRLGVGAGTDAGPQLTAVSSSAVRSSRDPAFLAEALQPEVLEYIRAHRLYGFADGPDPG
jgi:nicotinic acid mononucleotide adenylyltransferase